MPVIEINVIEGAFTHEEKREMVERLTEALLEVGGEGIREKTHALIVETPSGEWAVGGHALATKDVHSMRSTEAVA